MKKKVKTFPHLLFPKISTPSNQCDVLKNRLNDVFKHYFSLNFIEKVKGKKVIENEEIIFDLGRCYWEVHI